MNPFDLTGKTALVTGACGGLGRGMAEGLLEAGARVALLDLSPRLKQTEQELLAKGFACAAFVADLSDKTARERAFEQAVAWLDGRLEILIPAAGIQRRAPSEDFSEQDWAEVLDVNLTTVFALNQLAGRLMLRQGHGKIINIASMLSFFGGSTVPAYAASKGGVAQLTKALANEWTRHGVNVNAIAPGYMDTQMNTGLRADAVRDREILGRIPAGRWGTPEDLKGMAVFLSSAASDYVSGAIFPVDGGYLAK